LLEELKEMKKREKIGKITELDLIKKIRRFWTINPVTRIIPNKKKYNRKRDKNIKKKEEY